MSHNQALHPTASPLRGLSAAERCRYMPRPMGKVFPEWLRAFVLAAGIGRFCGASVASGFHQHPGQRGSTIELGVWFK